VDELHVFLNEYPAVPSYLTQPKIAVHRSQNHGNLGDAGKFFTVGTKCGYYLAIDDDIVFPDDFVWLLVNEVRHRRKKGNRVAVGMHGKVMSEIVEHYYRGHKKLYHCAHKVSARQRVHVIGTGALAFHTEDLKISIEDFEGPRNMADIHFSIACQKQGVGCVVLPHPAGYLQIQKIPASRTIWGRARHDDTVQTRLFNSWKDWRLRE
jgi:hypothetical protein